MTAREHSLSWCAEHLAFTREASRAIDHGAIHDHHIPGVALMENAASGLCRVAMEMLGGGDGPVAILCGPGNNGGDGFALARHLHNRGIETRLAALAPIEKYTGDADLNLRIAQSIGLVVRPLHHLEDDEVAAAVDELCSDASLIVDALLGTGLTSAPREPIAGVIRRVNAIRDNGAEVRVLGVDIPSGLDCDAGTPLGDGEDSAICADVTATMIGVKQGFMAPNAQQYTGALEIIDIGAPVELLVQHGKPR